MPPEIPPVPHLALVLRYFLVNHEIFSKFKGYSTSHLHTYKAVTMEFIGEEGVNIYIFVICPTSFSSNQIQIHQFQKKSVGQSMNISICTHTLQLTFYYRPAYIRFYFNTPAQQQCADFHEGRA